MPKAKSSPQAGKTRFKYKGPQAQFQVNNVTILRGDVYDTDSPDEIAALRARRRDGVVELAPKEGVGPDVELDDTY